MTSVPGPLILHTRLSAALRRLNAGQYRWGGAGVAVGLVLASVLISLTARTPSFPVGDHTDCGGPNRLTVATGADITAGSFRRDLIEEWNHTHTTQVVLVEVADPTDEQRAEMAGRSRLGSCAYDVLSVDVAWTTEFARSGYIRPYPLDPRQADLFLDNVLKTGQVDGVQYTVPFVTDVPLLFYRQGLPVPDTMERLWQYAAANGGYAVQLGDYEGGSVNLMEAIFSAGGRITDGDRVILDEEVNGERVRETLARWQTLLRNGTLAHGAEDFSKQDTFDAFEEGLLARSPKDSAEESSLQAFRDEDTGYMRNWPFAFHRLATDNSMYDDQRRLRFGLAALPGVGILGGFNLAISAYSDNPDKARMLIDFLTEHQAQARLFACSGYPPVLKSVYEEYRRTPRTCKQLLEEQPSPSAETATGLSGREDCTTGTEANPATGAGSAAAGSPGEDPTITALMLQELADKIHQGVCKAESRPAYSYYSAFSEVFRGCARAVVIGDLPAGDLDLPRFADALRAARRGRAPEGAAGSLAYCGKPERRPG
ncbi:extracellular solute-binding protein [Streptosporangium amethystogenes]|uniref:extracellular solute-binding protein n=1 Tax=Streptosporangium amethystogenes TaxID=2002 RepID=UPI0004C78BB2|nr:extracellular solute-binding protein [Streptosporangium amethystogenes]